MSDIESSQPIDAAGEAALKVMRQRRQDRFMRVAYGAGFPVVLLIIWEILCQIGVIDIRFFLRRRGYSPPALPSSPLRQRVPGSSMTSLPPSAA